MVSNISTLIRYIPLGLVESRENSDSSSSIASTPIRTEGNVKLLNIKYIGRIEWFFNCLK